MKRKKKKRRRSKGRGVYIGEGWAKAGYRSPGQVSVREGLTR